MYSNINLKTISKIILLICRYQLHTRKHCLVVTCRPGVWRLQVKGQQVMAAAIEKLSAYSLYELRLTVTNEGGVVHSYVNVTTLSSS